MDNPTFSHTTHVLCLYHLAMQNIPKNLRPKLGHSVDEFFGMWWKAQRSITEVAFEKCWMQCVAIVNAADVFDDSKSNALIYLERLHSSRMKWARPWTAKISTLGMQASGRVEKYQDLIKRGRVGSLLHHIKQIESLSKAFDEKQDFILSQSETRLPNRESQIMLGTFKPVLTLIDKYCSVWYKSVTQEKIVLSFTLEATPISEDEINQQMEEFEEDNDDEVLIPGDKPPSDIQSTHLKLISLKDLLANLTIGVQHVFEVSSRIGYSSHKQYIALLADGSHLCTDLLHCRAGIICEHFWAVQLKTVLERAISHCNTGFVVGWSCSPGLLCLDPSNSCLFTAVKASLAATTLAPPPSSAKEKALKRHHANWMSDAQKGFDLTSRNNPDPQAIDEKRIKLWNSYLENEIRSEDIREPPGRAAHERGAFQMRVSQKRETNSSVP
ncbi:hypothetical protein BDR26DRAFT_896823 [Obelidium mucronatum]|nr:hypothetical protein BDR26DRAFT_896823 [Obelidium mucronatum]